MPADPVDQGAALVREQHGVEGCVRGQLQRRSCVLFRVDGGRITAAELRQQRRVGHPQPRLDLVESRPELLERLARARFAAPSSPWETALRRASPYAAA